ncbi:hypothetical protein GHK92_07405 [Nocardioides sp. dk4132]|uniref:hypothetical protein n=1 Tax=unclassified Nocardioides TaxID=2615069 RepID=UPI0012953D58|nr:MULTISPECIES: hypothetical protein [unclassified Nocardioides]MQW75694.1 hypothetical protein [Nocardioides sp. dk4132]QGA08584.1 hypothetical protein GFH29_15155 [Nocardioides sp. dk884]
MARRVFFHVGVPKSGTTFLQTTMWNNRDQLRAQGFLYPGRRRMDHYHASQVVRGASPSALGENGASWERIVRELAAWSGDGVVSHEFFSMATARQARAAVEALAPAEVHVVVTARDYVRQFPAVWQEALKMDSTDSLDEFMRRAFAHDLPGAWSWNSQDVPAILRAWSSAVPVERVHVVTVPPPGAPRDLLWRRWCEVTGIDDGDFDMEQVFDNQSLGAVQAALLHRLKPHLTGPLQERPVQHRWVRQYFGHEVLGPQRGERFGLRDEDALRLRRRSRRMVRAIKEAGYPVVGDLRDLIPPAEQPARPHPDDVTDAEMLDAAVVAIEQMIRDVREVSGERDALARRTPAALARRTLRRARRRLRP